MPSLAAVLLGVLAVVSSLTSSADAAQVRLREDAFCAPTGLGTAPCAPAFETAQALAVDTGTHDLLVVDSQAKTLSRWKANGEADPFTALGTNVIDAKGTGPSCTPPSPECDGTPQNGFTFGGSGEVQVVVDRSGTATNGDIYVTQSSKHLVDVFGADGRYLGQMAKNGSGKNLGQPCGVAVDASGALYVSDFEKEKVFKYVSQGAAHNPLVFGDEATRFEFENPCILAAGTGSSAGALFVNQFAAPLWKLSSSSGAIEYEIESGFHNTVAVNPANGHVFALQRGTGRVTEYDASGSSPSLVSTTYAGSDTGIASAGTTDRLYVSAGNHVDVYGPPVPVPDVETKPASEIEATTATLKGTVNPNGAPLTECKFEYGETTAYGHSAPCEDPDASEVGSGTSPVEVHADVSGLNSETQYHFRLTAKNANSEQVPGHEQINGEDAPFKTKGKPVIEAAWAEGVLLSEATLKARINPEGLLSTYRIEWGPSTEAGYAHSTGDIEFGPDFSSHLFSLSLTGLTPGASYHWRVVATNDAAPPPAPPGGVIGKERVFTTYLPFIADTACPNQAFRTGAGASLPDCRGYEMVSPVDKGGSDIKSGVQLNGIPVARNQAFRSGPTARLTYTASRRFGDAVSQSTFPQYIATRGAEGWSNHGISPPRGVLRGGPLDGTDNEFRIFTPDLCSALVMNDDTTEAPLAEGGLEGILKNLYERSNCGAESYRWLAASELLMSPQGLTSDGSVALFLSFANLSQTAPHEVGSQLKCITPQWGAATEAGSLSYAWLRNGAPIPSATSPTYTATAEDEGAAIQCQITAGGVGGGSTQISQIAWVIAPYPKTSPPEAPRTIPAPTTSAPLSVSGPGEQTLSCDPNAGSWSGATGFSYRWYRNGARIAGATAQTYHVQSADLEAPAAFQCLVIGENGAGGATARVSGNLPTSPAPSQAPDVEVLGESGQTLYLADGEGTPHSVCVAPGGETLIGNCVAGSGAGSGFPSYEASVLNALSVDGSRVYWSDSAAKLYLRSNATEPQSALDSEHHCTEAAKACTTPISTGAASFWGARPDGSAAIYTEGSLASGAATLHLASVGGGAQPMASDKVVAGGVYGLLGASRDLSKIYLVSKEVLSGTEKNSEEDAAQAGQPNIYLYDAGNEGFRFVATLATSEARPAAEIRNPSPISLDPVGHAARVSPDGRTTAFESAASLSGYDNTDVASGEADREIYRYDAASGQLSCASCNPSGAGPHGRHVTDLLKNYWSASRLATAQHALYYPHSLSDNGNRVFFESFEPLVLADTNEAADVYEWEAPGEGDCTASSTQYSPQDEGCISLISSGKNAKDSAFFDATPDGSDVFFSTAASLVEQDPGLIDVYDARVQGGFPPPAGPEPPCEGEACQSPPGPPAVLTPSSAAFSGPGDLPTPKPKRCPKARRRVVRHGKARCVKRHRRHRHVHHRHHKHKRRHARAHRRASR